MRSISSSSVGHFQSVADKRTYDAFQKIQSEALRNAHFFEEYDESPQDSNRGTVGSVLLDEVPIKRQSSYRMVGVCEFDPQTKQVSKLDGEFHQDRLFGVAGKPPTPYTLVEPCKIETDANGGVTYRTVSGMARQLNGVLYVDETDALAYR